MVGAGAGVAVALVAAEQQFLVACGACICSVRTVLLHTAATAAASHTSSAAGHSHARVVPAGSSPACVCFLLRRTKCSKFGLGHTVIRIPITQEGSPACLPTYQYVKVVDDVQGGGRSPGVSPTREGDECRVAE